MKDWIVMIIGAAVLLVGLVAAGRTLYRTYRPPLPATGLIMIRAETFPGYGKVAVFRGPQGDCWIVAPENNWHEAPDSWCRK